MSSRIIIKNILATADVGAEIDLVKIVDKLSIYGRAKIRMRHIPSIIVKTEKSSVAVFRTGKIIISGASDIDTILSTAKKIISDICRETQCQKPRIYIENILAFEELDTEINREELYKEIRKTWRALYDPTQSPFIIVKTEKGTVLIGKRKIGYIGFRDIRDIEEMSKQIKTIILSPELSQDL
jgi:TATA-box binding protein (TBP) (component of TFIID and TFIIIB)